MKTGLHQVGKHLYKLCPDCGNLVKMTGFFKGWHLCVEQKR